MATKLTPNFTLEELSRTDVRRFQAINLAQAVRFKGALSRLAVEVLEPVRTLFNAPVVIHSGYRCPPLNEAIGGSPTSAHLRGEAADFHVLGWQDRQREALDRIAGWGLQPGQRPRFRQLLIEAGCLHVSVALGTAGDGEVAFYDVATRSKKIIRKGTL